ncbi:SAM-dependent methyltransferase [Bdellovibrio sp. HCB2-146]|uniref:SAM-dependent methyltransferase n=1 Tax=Bdellovibrio sp. HCB2-146 TaxID=3394362 RepID=UPI0039BCB48B
MLKLSPRLQTVYDHLLPGKPVWDFCCDHGYLGLNAYESGIFPEVHFVDQVPSIITNLQTRFRRRAPYMDGHPSTAFFHAVPAEEIREQLTGNVVMLGVGAHTIIRVLQQQNFSNVDRLILGPQKMETLVVDVLKTAPALAFSHALQKNLEVLEKERVRTLLVIDKMTQSLGHY